MYRRLSEAGLAPAIVRVTDDAIEMVLHRTLEEWLPSRPSSAELAEMKRAVRDLLLAAHERTGLCHRDVHIGNIVLPDDGRPLLIDPALAVPRVNERCYDLEGPTVSGVQVPYEHVRQGGVTSHGIWWGSPVKYRSLAQAFGPLA